MVGATLMKWSGPLHCTLRTLTCTPFILVMMTKTTMAVLTNDDFDSYDIDDYEGNDIYNVGDADDHDNNYDKMIRMAIMVMMIMVKMVMMKLIKMMRLQFGLVNTSNYLHVIGHKGHFRHFQKQWGIRDSRSATLSYKHRNISVFFCASLMLTAGCFLLYQNKWRGLKKSSKLYL